MTNASAFDTVAASPQASEQTISWMVTYIGCHSQRNSLVDQAAVFLVASPVTLRSVGVPESDIAVIERARVAIAHALRNLNAAENGRHHIKILNRIGI